VRKEIARIAGVSVGNVTKVKTLMITADPAIVTALQDKEISIHRAWSWRKLPHKGQRDKLWLIRIERGTGKTVRRLISAHETRKSSSLTDLGDLSKIMPALQQIETGSVRLVSVRAPGRIIFVTEELARTLRTRDGELFDQVRDS